MTNTKYIIIIAFLSLLLLGATYRFNLKDYDEECFEREKIEHNLTLYNSYIKDFSSTSIVSSLHNLSVIQVTNRCIAYHLVRRT